MSSVEDDIFKHWCSILGITYRDKSYDGYMNSQECLFGPGSEFLSQYKVLLRADLDTFPTPRLLGYWPEGVVADKGYGTMMGLDTIKDALRTLACSVGIEHQGWFNIGSSWYGDGRRVRNLSKLTVALNKYGRCSYQMLISKYYSLSLELKCLGPAPTAAVLSVPTCPRTVNGEEVLMPGCCCCTCKRLLLTSRNK